MKDKTKLEHEHDVVYPGKYLESNWIKPTSRKQQKDALKGHNGKDKNFYHLFKNANESDHSNVGRNKFEILNKGFKSSSVKRKISEAHFNKQLKPLLEKSIIFRLFS